MDTFDHFSCILCFNDSEECYRHTIIPFQTKLPISCYEDFLFFLREQWSWCALTSILLRTQLDTVVEWSVHCLVWTGPMITSYCTTTAARTCWCRVKAYSNLYKKYHCIWRIPLKENAHFAHFLFKILSVIRRVRQLYLHCKKYMPIISAVSTKNICSAYQQNCIHLILFELFKAI